VDADHAAKMTRGQDLFKKHVRPLLLQKCFKCHGGKTVESEFDLTDRDRLVRGGTLGAAVEPGNARGSLLYKLVTHTKEPHMPHNSRKLSDEAIAQLAAWIDCGAPYDGPLTGQGEAASWTHRTVPASARRHWAFLPLQHVEPPRVRNEGWIQTPIDRFILARLEAAGLTPNPAVGRRQLIRRAYFDVIGLPPTLAEVEAFVADTSPGAYERMIDRLLDSPHYGERWARHWLDLVRFAESHGFEHDYDRPSAYLYRDFVIGALNDDLPYDTFVKWQLAGDEFAPNNNQALMATGFLAAGVHSTQITKKEVEKQRYDELDDMVAIMGTSMLGLTVGCARCHDHKYDPIPQRDYYQLVATFTTTVRSEVDLDFDPAGYQKAKAAFDREHAPYEAALKKFEAEQLPVRLAAWEKSRPAHPDQGPWLTLDMAEARSEGGATFTKLDDGSLRAGGKNARFDIYTFVAHTDLTGITAVRLEALADPSLVRGGPGRAVNGNFALTDFRLTAAPKGGTAKPVPVRLRNPHATFEQKGLPIAAALADKKTSAWAIDPQFGKDHAAVFETEKGVGFPGGTTLTFTLQFKFNGGHNIGRPRLAITTARPPVALTGAGMPPKVMQILKTPSERRTAEQRAALALWYHTIDPEWRKLNQAVQDHLQKAPKPRLVKTLISTEGLPAVRLHTQGDDFSKETYFLRRGDPDQKEGVAAPGFLQVLTTAADPAKRWQFQPPKGWRTSYRRRALAEWLTDVDQGAGRLLARVLVNRLWQHHLGRGLVSTPSNFGLRGEPPSHPELLDWLATELIRNGWHLKPIHKMILASAVYAQSSHYDPAKGRIDPDNRLCWHRPPHRLEAEVIRDSLLAVSGELDPKMFGPGTLDPGSKRRSIYFTVKRSKLIPMMQVFDAPDALGGVGERPTSTVAPQALYLMNNPNMRAYARSFARRIVPDAMVPLESAVQSAYRIALARTPTADELADALTFVGEQTRTYQSEGKGDGREQALADFCQVLMALNEFVYVD
jgi:cytochrome c553